MRTQGEGTEKQSRGSSSNADLKADRRGQRDANVIALCHPPVQESCGQVHVEDAVTATCQLLIEQERNLSDAGTGWS